MIYSAVKEVDSFTELNNDLRMLPKWNGIEPYLLLLLVEVGVGRGISYNIVWPQTHYVVDDNYVVAL